jgi:hypothetical protein
MGRNHGAALLSCPGISTCMPREPWTPALINVRCTLHDDWAPKPLRQAFRKTNAGVSTAIPQGRSQSGHCSKAKCRPERQKVVPRSARPRRRARQNAARADETRARTRVIRSWLGCTRRLGERSFRSTDAMTDNSRKLARRRAGVSVVSSTFSIRRDRCSASDLSIARRSRSSISSFKCPRAFGAYFGLPGNLVSDIARCCLFMPADLLLFRAKFGDAFGAPIRGQDSCWCGERFPVARHGRRVSGPALESMVEGG